MRLPALLAIAALALGSACSGPSDEQRILDLVKDGAAALEAGEVDEAADALSDAYADASGRSKRDMVRLAAFALRQGRVRIWLREPQVEVRGAEAELRLVAFALQTNSTVEELADLIPTDARRFELALTLRREGRRWKVVAIDGEGIPAAPF